MKLHKLEKYRKLSDMYNGSNLRGYLNLDVEYNRLWTYSKHEAGEIIDIDDLGWIIDHYKKDIERYNKLDFTITYIGKPFNNIN